MNNKLEALKKDYDKLLIQVQAELVQKEHYKTMLKNTDELLRLSQARVKSLVDKLELSNNNYECLMLSHKKNL